MGHAIPGAEVLAEVQKWLEDDLKRRRADSKDRPGLSASATEVPTSLTQAKRLLETAGEELKTPQRTFRGVALLQAIKSRWPKTEPAEKARALLKEIGDDPKRLKLIEEQGGAEERLVLGAQARSLEKLGDSRAALKAWDLLAKHHPDTEDGKKATEEATRIRGVLAKTPYLGITFEGDSTTVQKVETKGPADVAGIQPGDKVIKLGETKVANLAELRRVLTMVKPGDSLAIDIIRKGTSMGVTLVVGKMPVD
jgi:C-terminal processing protease CtpA/Prc